MAREGKCYFSELDTKGQTFKTLEDAVLHDITLTLGGDGDVAYTAARKIVENREAIIDFLKQVPEPDRAAPAEMCDPAPVGDPAHG